MIKHTQYHRGSWTAGQALIDGLNQVNEPNCPTQEGSEAVCLICAEQAKEQVKAYSGH